MCMQNVKLRKRLICVSPLVILLLGSVGKSEIPNGYFTDTKPITELNTVNMEFYPTISYDGLTIIFSSSRPGGLGDFDFWMANRNEPNEPFGNIINLTAINSSAEDSSSTISVDGLTLIFASTRSGNYDLYQAIRDEPNQPFENVTDLGSGVNTSDAEWGPSLSADGLNLYFESSRPGGYGERDLWMVTRKNVCESFGNPVNLGSPPNSEFSETSPSISSDNLFLFFSTSPSTTPLPGGKGLADIWVTFRDSETESFGTPINLNDLWPGSQVNTEFEESYHCISRDWPADGAKLYYSYAQSLAGPPYGEIYEATWVLNCKYKLAGDSNDDCRNDLKDIALLAANWLIDCNVTPEDAACVPK